MFNKLEFIHIPTVFFLVEDFPDTHSDCFNFFPFPVGWFHGTLSDYFNFFSFPVGRFLVTQPDCFHIFSFRSDMFPFLALKSYFLKLVIVLFLACDKFKFPNLITFAIPYDIVKSISFIFIQIIHGCS